jgi:hypothetical protein
MSTLYFNSTVTGHGIAGTWDDANNWWSSSSLNTHAGRIPQTTDTVYICDTVTNVSNSQNYIITVRNMYFGLASPAYNGGWNDDNQSFQIVVNCTNLYGNYGYINAVNTTFNVSTITNFTGSFIAEGYNSNDTNNVFFYQNGGTINFRNTTTLGGNDNGAFIQVNNAASAHFYDTSANGKEGGGSGYVYVNGSGSCNFHNTATNGQANGNAAGAVNSYVYGNANFYDSSTNCSSGTDNGGNDEMAIGFVYGTATFYNSATNYSSVTDTSSNKIIWSNGQATNLVYAYSRTGSQLATEIQASAKAQTATIPVTSSGGISKANILITELIKLPFPVIV